MFGTNVITGKAAFREMPAGTLKLASAPFFTLQGEGPLSGLPAVFLRLAHCNLACSFCDTYFEAGDIKTFDEIDDLIDEAVWQFFDSQGMDVPSWARTLVSNVVLVVTGGEPLLQKNIHEYIRRSHSTRFAQVQIESNGIMSWNVRDSSTVLVVSPKASEKNGVPTHHIKPHPTTLDRADCLKFVIKAPESKDDTNPYTMVPQWAINWLNTYLDRTIYVSPMNAYLKEPQAAITAIKTSTDLSLKERAEKLERISFWEPGLLDMEQNQKNHEYAALLAMREGFRLSLQTHLLASLP